MLHPQYLPPATKLGQGYVFTRVCECVHGGGGIPACIAGGIPSCLAAGLGGGIPACLAGFQAHTHGGKLRGLARGMSPGPHPRGLLRGLAGGARPRPRGISRPRPSGVYPSMH